MSYSIIGTGTVGPTLASFFAEREIPVALANTRGSDAVRPIAVKLGETVVAQDLDEALRADVVFAAVPALNFKELGSRLPDWAGKIVIDVTNAFTLPIEVQEAEYGPRTSSEVNAEHVPGARLVKAFNQLPMKVLRSPVPAGGKRVVFVSSDHEDASVEVARLAEDLGFAAVQVGKLSEGGRLIQARNALSLQDLIKFGIK